MEYAHQSHLECSGHEVVADIANSSPCPYDIDALRQWSIGHPSAKKSCRFVSNWVLEHRDTLAQEHTVERAALECRHRLVGHA